MGGAFSGGPSQKGKKPRRPQKEAKNFFAYQREREEEEAKMRQLRMEEESRISSENQKPNLSNDVRNLPEDLRGGRPPMRPMKIIPQTMQNYDEEAIARMKMQLRDDINAFLLNNIMMSMQFFENYENTLNNLKNHSVTEADVHLNDEMAQHHKHVLLPDKLQEAIDSNVKFSHVYVDEDLHRDKYNNNNNIRPYRLEPLQPQRMYVVHDNVEVSEPGETADYSTVMGASLYKLVVEVSDEPGYIKLRTKEPPQSKSNLKDSYVPKKMKSRSSDDSGSTSSGTIDDDLKEEGYEEDVDSITPDFMTGLKNRIEVQSTTRNAFQKPNVELSQDSTTATTATTTTTITTPTERPLSGILKNSGTVIQKSTFQKPPRKVKSRTERIEKKTSGSETSGYKSSNSPQNESSENESDYGYATFVSSAAPRHLQLSKLPRNSDPTSVIPSICFSVIEKKNRVDDDEDSETPYGTRYGVFQRELYKKLYYLNSNQFMINFQDLFLSGLANSLGFFQDSISNALVQDASIYCSSYGEHANKNYEIIPAVNSTWPCDANEWILRERIGSMNPRTKAVYIWPTPDMVGKAKALGCLMLPVGFRPVRGSNPQQGLQWKIAFPAIERYLETCMAHSQIRCYIFTMIMFKTFMQNDSSKIGLNSAHFKNHLFWQLENNFIGWPEDRLGEVFRRFIKSFYDKLMKYKMRNYFVRECNMLKGIPKAAILKQQKSLFNMMETPVMHLLAALKNVKYVKSDYYPILDIERLYRILTTNDILQLVNPQIPIEDDKTDLEDDEFVKKQGFWIDKKKEANPEYAWNMERLRQINAKKAAKVVEKHVQVRNEIDKKRKIVDFDMNRKRLILQLFIPHFIAMADCSVKFDAIKQAMIYLEHARRLTIILKDEPGGQMAAIEHLEVINEKIGFIRANGFIMGPPKVPRRNDSFSNENNRRNMMPQHYINVQTGSEYQSDNVESPTIKFTGATFVDVHVDLDKPKFNRTISFKNESGEENVFEESKL